MSSTAFNTGAKKSPIDVRDYKIKCSAVEELPDEYSVDVLPKVKNQGSVGSCVAHATSSILEYYDTIAGGNSKLSTNFIYGLQKSECGHDGEGMYLRDACKIVCKYGDMLEEDCKGNTEVPDCWEIAEKSLKDTDAKNIAEKFKIKSYFSCNSVDSIKKAIMNYGPVLGMVHWYDSFKPNSYGVIDTNTVGDRGYHAIMIYGWNEIGFLCQNSWGDKWGRNGRFTIPYEIEIEEAKGLIDDITSYIVVPKRNIFLDIIYKFINFILNIFKN